MSRFVERNGETDYVQIHPGDGGCYAVIPYRIGGGMREVGLQQNGCVYTKIVIHELLHVVGVKHEQCRPDRDDYITINWSNIASGGPSQYYKVNKALFLTVAQYHQISVGHLGGRTRPY